MLANKVKSAMSFKQRDKGYVILEQALAEKTAL